jgi:hypothetical protein
MTYDEAMTRYIVNGNRGKVVYSDGDWSYVAPHKQVCTLNDGHPEYTQWPCDEISCSKCEFFK